MPPLFKQVLFGNKIFKDVLQLIFIQVVHLICSTLRNWVVDWD